MDELSANIYLYVINVFDTKNIENVFLRTGNTSDDGYISNPTTGGKLIEQFGAEYEALYKAINIDYSEQWQGCNNRVSIYNNTIFLWTAKTNKIRRSIRVLIKSYNGKITLGV